MNDLTNPKNLRQWQDELASLAAKLTDPITLKVIRDDLTTTTHTKPGLLEQLRQAHAHGGETGKASGSSPGAPIRVAAADLQRNLDREAATLHFNTLVQDADVVSRIRAAAGIAGRWADVHRVANAVLELRYMVERIEELLDPPRRLHIAAACPACGQGMVWRLDPSTGELVQAPALALDARTGCTCLGCGQVWGPENLEFLQGVLTVEQTQRPRLRSSAEGNGHRSEVPLTHTGDPDRNDDQAAARSAGVNSDQRGGARP
ncbi:DUF7340 domain-containing protein [Amycolatopsis azurea]|uniref:Uncharacterized protein n=1 Tax=Amycolatopsis azurea DSM 43854 TaxID=1238180 RepID=M2PTR1_9PSEU|nr:hypothetical protein [Amycolatopsis azurea]EMD22905.1 hypothetical protein C791_7905 [Amycolatopsis azurea DSM 43854]OOC04270.1 hypothetical protein B0293_23725 [Amycolatopsis azurea DSM 43854]